MKFVGTILPDTTEEVSAEGEDYTDAREKLVASIPKTYTLLHVRHEN